MVIREARPGDEAQIIELIRALAIYEKEPDAVINTPEALRKHLFLDKICAALVAEMEGDIVGFALYYNSYSTWKGPCLYLEDFYVTESCRRHGIGQALFERVVQIAKEQQVKRLEWQVLEWNKPAIDFYLKAGAVIDDSWLNGRMYFD